MPAPPAEAPRLEPLDRRQGPAQPLSLREEDALVEAVLECHFSGKRRRLLGWKAAALILISFGAVGIATAVTVVAIRYGTPRVLEDPPAVTSGRPKQRPPKQSPRVTIPVEAPSSQPARIERKKPPRRPRRAVSRARKAADLLARANRLRAGRRWREAERSYREVMRAHPGSAQAYSATVAAAALRLEQLVDPRGALRLYEQARRQRPRGHLAQEVLFGVAECHRALGADAAEARALRAFLAAHPRGPMAARARARLDALGGRAP
jgi:hypothetical protein